MTKVSFRQTLRAGFGSLRAAFKAMLLFEVLYKTATVALTQPLLSLLMQLLLRLGGDELAFNDGIWRFALTLPGILAIVVLAGIAVVCAYFEFSVLVALAKQAQAGEPAAIKAAVVRSLWSLGSLRSPDVPLFALYALLLLPLVNTGVTSSLVPRLTVPNFITGELSKTPAGAWLLLGAAALVAVLALCLLFVLPAMVLEHRRYLPAVKRSLITLRAYGFKALGLLLVFACAWLALFLLPRQIFDFFFGTPDIGFFDAVTSAGLSLRTPVLVLIWLAAALLQTALTPLLLTLLTACYWPLAVVREPERAERDRLHAGLDRLTGWLQAMLRRVGRFLRGAYRRLLAVPFVQKHKKLLAVLVALSLASAVVSAFATATGVHGPIVIGHRGSAAGVENTLEAIQEAIDTGADYAEVDILLSADGVPMVIHDTNLRRLADRDVNVYELTAEELGEIPLAQGWYTGRISTLEEVVAYCEGKIRLAVELKLHGREQADLVDQVMRVMEKSAWQKSSVYLSLDYGLVAQMKEKYPAYRAGYCVYGNVGELSAGSVRGMNIDFLLVEEWMVSRKLVDACRRAWVPVYVWTVNDPEQMADYLSMGVVGLVTDYPGAAMEVLEGIYDLSTLEKPYNETKESMEIVT